MKQELNKRSSEKGFTLVELAIVMIIIGLLIGGILKGQELIANASLTSTVSQVKAVDAATTTFKDMYNAFPGDMATPGARIPNCPASATDGDCGVPGDGNGQLEGTPSADRAALAENLAYWLQLESADVLSVGGQNFLQAEIGGNFGVGYGASTDNADFAGAGDATNYRSGHYLVLSAETTGAVTAADASLTANEAARIDSKLDDGAPNTGTVRAFGAFGNGDATDCMSDENAADVYSEANTTDNCGLYIRFQQ